jgi:hypothetical protein
MLSQLWLPIVASAAAVWIVSALAWMALPHHKKDHDALPDEKGFQDYLKSAGIGPGVYGFPDFKNCKGEEAKAKWASGAPMGLLTVWGRISMGRNMLLTFLVYLVVSVFIAYLGAAALSRGDSCRHVFRVLGTAGILAYSFAFLPNGIWFGMKPRTMVLNVIDGIVYGLVTGAIFAWLWPRM